MYKTLLLLLLPLANFAQTPASNATPANFKTNFTETFYGRTVQDPYRSLEDTGNAAVKQWMRQEAERTTQILQSLPGYEKLRQDARKAIEGSKLEEFYAITKKNGTWYAVKRYPTKNNPFIYQYNATGKEAVMLDPEVRHKDLASKNLSVEGLNFSAAGRYFSYYLVVGGYEMDPLTIIDDTKTGKKNVEPWLNGGNRIFQGFDPNKDSVFYYWHLPFRRGDDPLRWWDSSMVYRRIIGTDTTKDELMVDFASQKIQRTVKEGVYLDVLSSKQWAFAVVKNMVSKELRIYTTPLATLSPNSEWKKICDYDDAVTNYASHGSEIYLMSYKNASRFNIISVDLRQPDITKARVVLPEQNFVLEQMLGSRDALFVSALSDKGGKLIYIPYTTLKPQELKLPVPGQVSFNYSSAKEPDLMFTIRSWVRTPQLFRFDGASKKIVPSFLQKFPSVGTNELEVKEVKVPGHDGVMVPMTIIHKKGLRMNGNNMLALNAYGAYGMQDNPYYWPEDLVRYQRGYVKAVAHVRGGGIYGEDWHKAGMMTTKPNTWKDAISCAEYLIKNGYTSPDKLMISGGSAGGITAGRAITERPDLFKAALISVGCIDMVGAERSPNGLGNITEFGSTTTEEGFNALYEMSTYHQVKDNTPYPAVLFVHGFNDTRVPVYHSTKGYARFKEASTSGRPLLLRIDFDSGHGAQESTEGLISRFADMMSFFYWMMGVPEFQPKKPM